MAIVNCGCNGQVSDYLLDGEVNIERTVDIGFCRLHAAAPQLLAALKAEHEALDRVFTLLIERDRDFYPSTSGQPWAAMLLGKAAIAAAEGE